MDNNMLMQNQEFDEQTPTMDFMELTVNDMVRYASMMSGLKADGTPKSILSYASYDFDAPDNDPEKDEFYFCRPKRIDLSLDKVNGHYLMDVVFDDCEEKSLKMFWARLQRHRMNEIYASDKTWVFYMKLVQDEDNPESGVVYTANMFNPLAYFLIRTVPNEVVRDYEVDTGVHSGGNTVRLLFHPNLVTFEYEDVYAESEDDSEMMEDET